MAVPLRIVDGYVYKYGGEILEYHPSLVSLLKPTLMRARPVSRSTGSAEVEDMCENVGKRPLGGTRLGLE